MKNNKFPKFDLFETNLTWWIPGLVLAFPVVFLLNYFAVRVFPKPDIYTYALGYPIEYPREQQLRFELIILSLFNMITPVVINTIEIFCTDLTRNGNKRETKKLFFGFSFNLTKIKRPVPYMLAVMLIVAEKAFIISMMIYLRENYYNALSDSMDFLIGAPYLDIAVASLLLVIDCALIFCIVLFLFFWGYSWVQWVSDRVFPGFSGTKFYSQSLLLASLIFRALNMLGVIFVINFMATFSGEFDTVVKIIFRIIDF